MPDLPVKSKGTCTYYFGAGTCPTVQDNDCPTCPQITANPPCQCDVYCPSKAPPGCSSLYAYNCTSQCQKINAPMACPNGTYVTFSKSGNAVSAVCNYVPAATNLQWFITQQPSGSGFPSAFYVGMIQRYAISQYISTWNTQLFEDSDGSSFFHQNVDYTNSGQESIFRQVLLNSLNNVPVVIPSLPLFQSMLQNAIEYPQMVYSSGGVMSMLFYTYGAGLSINPSNGEISAYLQSFTMERPQDVSNLAPFLEAPANTCPPNTNNACTFAIPPTGGLPSDLATNPWYIFVDLTTYKVYNINVPPSQLQTIQQVRNSGLSGDDFYVIGRIYNVQVQKLSPILTYLFAKQFPNLPFDKLGAGGLCDRIQHDTTQVPSKCYNNTCSASFSATCKSLITSYCRVNSIPNKWAAMNCSTCGFSHFFLTSNGDQCQCYDTPLPPPVIGEDNLPAMCFTSFCTQKPELMKAFGLTDEYCSQYCAEVWDWLNDPDPAKRSANPYVLDAGQFQRLCGTYTPEKSKANYYVLGGGVVLSLIVGVLAFILSRNIWLGLGLFLGILAFGIFLSFDLNGVPYCSATGSACQTRITHIPIPGWFCSYWLGCECGIGKACANNDVCVAGVCIPPTNAPLKPIKPPPPPLEPIGPPQGGPPNAPRRIRWTIP